MSFRLTDGRRGRRGQPFVSARSAMVAFIPYAAAQIRILRMIEETISRRGNVMVRRLVLAPGEATPWHIDPFHRLTVIIRGDALAIEHRDGTSTARIEVAPGMSDWDEPTGVVHRGVNAGQHTY